MRNWPTKLSTPTLLGIPFDANSSYLRGAAEAPPLIREAFHCDSSNSWTETGVDLRAPYAISDLGDLTLSDDSTAFDSITRAVHELIDTGHRPVCLGGDHSITFPILRAVGHPLEEITIIHFDAHPDLYQEFEGKRFSHACPFARIMEDGYAKRLIQLGIRTMNEHQRLQAGRFGVEVIEMRDLPALDKLKLEGPLYISFDVECARSCIRAWDFTSRAGRDVGTRGGCAPARDHRRHCGSRPGGVQPETGYLATDRDGVRENPERDTGENDRGIKRGAWAEGRCLRM